MAKRGAKVKLSDPRRREKLLRALRDCGNLKVASRAAGISFMTLNTYRKSHPQFAQEVEEAVSDSIDALEAVAYKKAKRGDGPMLRFMLATQRPEKYALKHRLEHSGRIDGHVNIQVVEDEDWYGIRAASLVAESDAAPSGSAPESGALQGSGVRPAVGQNGHRSNGHH